VHHRRVEPLSNRTRRWLRRRPCFSLAIACSGSGSRATSAPPSTVLRLIATLRVMPPPPPRCDPRIVTLVTISCQTWHPVLRALRRSVRAPRDGEDCRRSAHLGSRSSHEPGAIRARRTFGLDDAQSATISSKPRRAARDGHHGGERLSASIQRPSHARRKRTWRRRNATVWVARRGILRLRDSGEVGRAGGCGRDEGFALGRGGAAGGFG
jgi:hypothetical protein